MAWALAPGLVSAWERAPEWEPGSVPVSGLELAMVLENQAASLLEDLRLRCRNQPIMPALLLARNSGDA